MNGILLCTQNRMLIKGLYGMLRDEGYSVDLSDYPAHAVQQIMKQPYEAAIIDSEVFGMTANEAAGIINAVAPDIKVILTGLSEDEVDTSGIRVSADPESLRKLLQSIHH